MSHRINVMIEDGIWEELKRVPEGERSRFINRAVSNEILFRKRQEAVQVMDRLRSTGKPLGVSSERLVRSDRSRHK